MSTQTIEKNSPVVEQEQKKTRTFGARMGNDRLMRTLISSADYEALSEIALSENKSASALVREIIKRRIAQERSRQAATVREDGAL